MRVRVNDNVEVVTGDDQGKRGRVLSVDRETNRVVVEGVNRVYKHVRRSQRNPQGGRLSKELAIDVSNVMVVCGKCGKASRVGVRTAAYGKERFCKKCGAPIPAQRVASGR